MDGREILEGGDLPVPLGEYGVANERRFSKIPVGPVSGAFTVLLNEVGMDIADFTDIASDSSAGSISILCCFTPSLGFNGNLRKEVTEAPLIDGRLESVEPCESLCALGTELILLMESTAVVWGIRVTAEGVRVIVEVDVWNVGLEGGDGLVGDDRDGCISED